MTQIEQVGIVLTIILALAFYVRLLVSQYNKARHLQLKAQAGKKGKNNPPKPARSPFLFDVRVLSWPWVIAGCALLVVGAFMSTIPNITTPFWWLPVDGGIVILWFFLK